METRAPALGCHTMSYAFRADLGEQVLASAAVGVLMIRVMYVVTRGRDSRIARSRFIRIWRPFVNRMTGLPAPQAKSQPTSNSWQLPANKAGPTPHIPVPQKRALRPFCLWGKQAHRVSHHARIAC